MFDSPTGVFCGGSFCHSGALFPEPGVFRICSGGHPLFLKGFIYLEVSGAL